MLHAIDQKNIYLTMDPTHNIFILQAVYVDPLSQHVTVHLAQWVSAHCLERKLKLVASLILGWVGFFLVNTVHENVMCALLLISPG